MHKFKELVVWQKSVDLAVDVYRITKKFPTDERFGVISRMNRSAVSVSSNIAEGAGRNTDGEFKNFLGIASGSSFELETQLIIANKLNIVDAEDFEQTNKGINEIQNMLFGLQKSLHKN
jgi:four helix bundle protein